MWHGRIARKKVHLWFGEPGAGKGYAVAAVTACVTTGRTLPGETAGGPPATVLLCNGEDGAEDVLRPRIEAMAGDLRRIHVVRFQELNADGITYLRRQVVKYKPALVVIDPLYAFSGRRVDLNRGNQTRPIFNALARLAEEYECAVVVIHHTNKSETTKALHRAAASQDIIAAARVAHLFGFPSGQSNNRAMIPVKSNLGALGRSLGYTISTTGEFSWTGESSLTEADVLGVARQADSLEEAKEFLREQLSHGPKPVAEIFNEARSLGLSFITVRRASTELGVIRTATRASGKRGVQQWVWQLPTMPPTGGQP
jgi:hypothetical protein